MSSKAPGQIGPRAPREADQQCLVREANEAVERVNAARAATTARTPLRCECGDPDCRETITPTHAEYEGVRMYGSHFLIRLNHENPETTAVLSENARFAVIDVVVSAARYHVLARNPRHAWVDAQARSAQ
jgi:hypothetical protein